MIIMNLTLDSIKYFILNGKFENGLDVGISKDDVIKIFGTPPNFLPQKKKNKAIMSWGALNIYLYSSIVTDFSINITFNYLDNLNMETIEEKTIIEYLKNNSISFDNRLSIIDDDTNYVSFDDIELGFRKSKLSYVTKGKWEQIK